MDNGARRVPAIDAAGVVETWWMRRDAREWVEARRSCSAPLNAQNSCLATRPPDVGGETHVHIESVRAPALTTGGLTTS